MKVNNFSFSIDDNGIMTVYVNDDIEKSVATISECEEMSNQECENLAIEVLSNLGYEISL